MKSLAEFLQVDPDPAAKPEPTLELATRDYTDLKEFGEAVLNSIEFRLYIFNGLRFSPPGFSSILGRLMDHIAGRAPERIEHTGKDGGPIEMVTEVRRIVVRVPQQQDEERSESVH